MSEPSEAELGTMLSELTFPDGIKVTVSDFKRFGAHGWQWKWHRHEEGFLNEVLFHTDENGHGFYMDFDAGLSWPMNLSIVLSDIPLAIRSDRNSFDVFIQAQTTLFAFLREKTPCQSLPNNAL
jgi:hypothetical protein